LIEQERFDKDFSVAD
jgi:hypothetical protein